MSNVGVRRKYLIGMVIAGMTNRHIMNYDESLENQKCSIGEKKEIYIYDVVLHSKIIICSSFYSRLSR